MYWQPLWAKEIATWSQPQSENERQQSVNDFVCCILYKSMAVLRHLTIIEVLAAFTGNIVFVDTATWQNECQQNINRASRECQHSIITASTECQQSVNDFGHCILNNPSTLLWHIPRINVLAAIMSKRDRNMVTAPVWKWASTECPRFCVLHLVHINGCAKAFNHNRSIGSLYRQYRVCRYCDTTKRASTEHQQSVKRASTQHHHSVNRVSTECQRFWALHLE